MQLCILQIAFAEVISKKSSLRIYDVFAKGSSPLDCKYIYL